MANMLLNSDIVLISDMNNPAGWTDASEVVFFIQLIAAILFGVCKIRHLNGA